MNNKCTKLVFIIILLSPVLASSQKVFFSAGAELAFPMGNYMEMGHIGAGGSLRMEHAWSKQVSGTLTIEYIAYSTNQINEGFTEKFSALPIQFGVKYYTRETKKFPEGFYISWELGFTGEFYTSTFSSAFAPEDTHHDSYVGLCTTFGAGYQLGIVDFGYRLQAIVSGESGGTLYSGLRIAVTIR